MRFYQKNQEGAVESVFYFHLVLFCYCFSLLIEDLYKSIGLAPPVLYIIHFSSNSQCDHQPTPSNKEDVSD